ncbi:hypothetical protein [Thalassobacillus sp. CUG 92003]|uniref:hypothetical protein n=1 Tax=Thalassobacillus sp. CUG 92003 TaxID=2736641 RepID=UPI0015E667B8|nr:hypothetical protein [Thalassobacillus sp. CUG 92003]
MIKTIGHITQSDPDKFHADLTEYVDSLQSKGIICEIQYQQSDHTMSALILGRDSSNAGN